MKVVEIFDSFQGEGIYTGEPATFLRLGGCNLNCDFCDTEFDDYKEIDVELVKECLLNHIKNHKNKLLVITGGEPLLHYDEIKELVDLLHYQIFNEGLKIQIETNGFIRRIPIRNTTYVISPKRNIDNVFKFYKDYDDAYFKFVIEDFWDLRLVKSLQEKYDYKKTVWLQPEFSQTDRVTRLILSKNINNIRISGQLHKYMGVE